jgi:hypothetical protein
LEKEFAERYLHMKQLADQELVTVTTSAKDAEMNADSPEQEAVCTLSSTAEHGGDEACDDGRAGK